MVDWHADAQQPQNEATAPQQAASGEASGAKSKEPQSGFDDVIIPDDSNGRQGPRAVVDGAGPSGPPGAASNGTEASRNQGIEAFPQGADQDDAQPEATLPGGTVTGGSKNGAGRNQAHASDTKQKKLDWSAAAAGHKRRAGSNESPGKAALSPGKATRTPPKRQCKLKLTTV